MNKAFEAMVFAREAHATQVRKYTGNPYADHLAEVAGIVSTVLIGLPLEDQEIMLAVAWLHDTVEDQGIGFAELQHLFGVAVADGVRWLSDLEEGNRATRKAAACARLAKAPGWVQTIKCADLISNSSSICWHDPNFAIVYVKEANLLLDVLDGAEHRLHNMARQQLRLYAGKSASSK